MTKNSRLLEALTGADAVVVGAGAGLSTSAGFTYSGERFQKYFADFIEAYGFSDMYSAGFYPFKTLEEPRPNTYFLLQTEPSSSLLATIYSRCQVWNVPLPTEEEALTWLSSQFQAETSELLTALAMNFGRPLLALDTLQQGLIEQRKNFLRQFWLFYRRRSPLEILPFFEKERTVQQIDWILAFLSDAIKYKLEIQSGWQTLDLKKGVTQFADEQTALGLLTANKIMQKVRSDLLTINGVNTELMLLDGLTKLITDVFKD